MPSATATVRSTPPAAGAVVSRSQGAAIGFTASGVPTADFGSLYLAIGQHSSRPTTYADLSATDVGAALDLTWSTGSSATLSMNANGSVAATAVYAPSALTGLTAGQPLWLALFNGSDPPASSATPIAVAGPFTVTS